MSLNQVTIEIPLNIQKGLDSGIYKRYGSIIINSSGHIVKHLKEVKAGEAAQQVVKGLAKWGVSREQFKKDIESGLTEGNWKRNEVGWWWEEADGSYPKS